MNTLTISHPASTSPRARSRRPVGESGSRDRSPEAFRSRRAARRRNMMSVFWRACSWTSLAALALGAWTSIGPSAAGAGPAEDAYLRGYAVAILEREFAVKDANL